MYRKEAQNIQGLVVPAVSGLHWRTGNTPAVHKAGAAVVQLTAAARGMAEAEGWGSGEVAG